MKTTLLFTINLLIFPFCFAQTEVLHDSIAESIQKKQETVFRCQSTIRNESPLFVIDGIPMPYNSNALNEIDPDDIVSVKVLKEPLPFSCYGSLGENGIVLITTKKGQESSAKIKKDYPFKTYSICNSNWNTTQDIYNSIQTKVPGVSISTSTFPNQTPSIKMRGDANTIVIVDGIRYDTSILNTLNPSDIEHIAVALSAAAMNYFINN